MFDTLTRLGASAAGDYEIEFTKTGSSNDFMCGLNLVSDEPGVLTDTIIKWETQGTSWFTKDNHSLKVGGSVVLNPGAPMIGEGDTCKWTRSNGVISFIKNGATLHTFTQQSTAPVRFGINGGGGFNGNGFSDISWTFDNTYTFTDSSGVEAGIGTDLSGQGNHFTVNNLSSSDILPDSPFNNYATLNSRDENAHYQAAYSKGSLQSTGHPTSRFVMGASSTMATSNKIYYEWYISARGNNYFCYGIGADTWSPTAAHSNDADQNRPGKNHPGWSWEPGYNAAFYDADQTVGISGWGGNSKTVSYTHLTLPTNREV